MIMMTSRRKFGKIIKIILFTCIIIFFVMLYRHNSTFKEITNLAAVSFLISYTLRPVFKIMVKKGMNKRLLGACLVLIVVILLCGTICLIIPAILKESLNISNTVNIMQKAADNFYGKIKLLSGNKIFYKVFDDASGRINNYISLLFSRIFEGAVKLGQNFLDILVIPIISYYFLVDSGYFKKIFLSLFPINMRNASEKVVDDIDKILGRYIVSQIFLCIIISLCTFIILIFLKVDYPVILSVLNGFFNIIPYFGPIFGSVPAVLIALLKSPRSALYTVIWLYILQTVEGNLLSPKITGDSISMHPFFVIILLILGGRAGGIAGMVLSVPIGAAVLVIMDDINYYLF